MSTQTHDKCFFWAHTTAVLCPPCGRDRSQFSVTNGTLCTPMQMRCKNRCVDVPCRSSRIGQSFAPSGPTTRMGGVVVRALRVISVTTGSFPPLKRESRVARCFSSMAAAPPHLAAEPQLVLMSRCLYSSAVGYRWYYLLYGAVGVTSLRGLS